MNGCKQSASKVFKLVGGFNKASSRCFSSEKLIPKDLKIVKNPTSEQIKQFQKLVGDFNDIKLLKETMKDNYQLYLLCHKGIYFESCNISTNRFFLLALNNILLSGISAKWSIAALCYNFNLNSNVMSIYVSDSTVLSGTQSITYKSLNRSIPDFQTFGLSYQPDNTYNLLPHLMHEMATDFKSVKMNSGGCVGRISLIPSFLLPVIILDLKTQSTPPFGERFCIQKFVDQLTTCHTTNLTRFSIQN